MPETYLLGLLVGIPSCIDEMISPLIESAFANAA